jgi:hypothetical protein
MVDTLPWCLATADTAAAAAVCGRRTLSVLAAPSMSAAASPDAFPSELLAFALADGRSGVLSVR